jgi:sec-independent protein translocase protein TatA
MFDFSPVQIILVLAIALLVLGPKRLPAMARSLGDGVRGFRDSLAGPGEPDEFAATVVAAAEEEARERDAPARLQPAGSAEPSPDGQGALTGPC